jgi:uncharacterized protein (DUF952 family)
MTLIYKILSEHLWLDAVAKGVFSGAGIDIADGYIHLSTAAQTEETAQKHFASVDNLVLVAFDPNDFAPLLKWETSRGGALFPHVYGMIDTSLAKWVKPLPWAGAAHDFPMGWNT